MFCFIQLWNEFGCVKCKAGLCPAYVPPIDIENDQPQDLPPKGTWTLHTFTSSPGSEKGWSTCHWPVSLQFITSDPVTLFASHLMTLLHNKQQQIPLSTTTIHPFYPGDVILRFYSQFPFPRFKHTHIISSSNYHTSCHKIPRDYSMKCSLYLHA